MACTFTIPFNGTPSSLVATIKTKILAGNGQFDGDNNVGKFSIHAIGATIEGGYGICENDIIF
jgi:hypothetical protein